MSAKVWAAALMVVGLSAAQAWAAPPPASAFGRLPEVQSAAISPDGSRVAILGGPAGDRRVMIATIDHPELPSLRMGDVEAVDVMWANDDYALARIAFWDHPWKRYSYRLERNIVVDTSARAVSRLLEGVAGPASYTGQPVIGITDGTPTKVMIGTGGLIWWAEIPSGRGAIAEGGGPRSYAWRVDSQGEARVRLDGDAKTIWVMGRAKGASVWRVMWTGPWVDAPRVFCGYSEPEDAAILFEEGPSGAGRLVRKKLADGSISVIRDGLKDGEFGARFDRYRKTLVGLVFEDDRTKFEWLDPELGGVHAALAKLFPGQDVSLENWSKDRSRFVIRTFAPDSPPQWYLFDRKRKELSPLGAEYPELKGVPLGTTQWIKYKAADGLEIPAYLTLPPGAESAKNLPLIVIPHGGPAARDDDDFDYIRQFLATRGYAVLQPQFRGSYGFGRAFELAGRHEWGRKMQTDLLDGIAAVGATGRIDPKRVCIFGWSFGGYAAMTAAALHPDAYKCAASFAGISDLGMLIGQEIHTYGLDADGVQSLRRDIDDAPLPELVAISPAKQAAKVGIPLLLMHGDKDTVVPMEQSQVMADALKAENKPYELAVFPGQDHYLMNSGLRTKMLEELGAFLDKNLGVTR